MFIIQIYLKIKLKNSFYLNRQRTIQDLMYAKILLFIYKKMHDVIIMKFILVLIILLIKLTNI